MPSFSKLNKRVGNIFLRVYLGVLSALIGALLLGLLLISLANTLRLEAYNEKLVTGLFSLLAEDFAQVEPGFQLTWLEHINASLDIQINLNSLDQFQLNQRQLNRLQQQRPLFKNSGEYLHLLFPTHLPDQVLETRLTYTGAQQASSSAYLLRRDLHNTPVELRPERLEQLKQKFAYPLTLLQQPPEYLDKIQQLRLHRGEQIAWLHKHEPALTSLIQLDSSSLLQLGPVQFFNPYPGFLNVSIFLSLLLVLAACIWWFLQHLEQDLRPLERASIQLATGNLRARVKVSGADFITRLGLAYNRMAEQLQRMLSTQQEMIHAVSHELRTPVARIRFGLQMIEDLSEAGAPHTALAHQIQGLDQDIDELNTLIDEILTYARLGQEELNLQFSQQQIITLVEEVVDNFQRTSTSTTTPASTTSPNPTSLAFHLHIDNPGQLNQQAELDARYFQRALQNLIGNALRYAQSQIVITCHIEEESFRIDVEDDGPGIASQDCQRIFVPFSRLDDSRTRSSGGYGLGLSIVQRIMFWHQGSALVDRSPSLHGARFSLVFPKAQALKPNQITQLEQDLDLD